MMPAGGNDHSRIIPVPNGQRIVILKGDPDDEIAEKWNELSGLAVVALISIFVLVAAFYFVLGWILNPLAALARGLVALEAGERSQRLDIPRVEDVADISRKFNSLAASLDQTRAENGELYRQIQSVQEDERREIARELHDEAGPCLFGITASAESVKALAKKLAFEEGQPINKRIDEILSVAGRLKLMNRALLKRLHPVSIGKVPLAALIKDLIYDFERRHPEVTIVSKLSPLIRVYGDKIDLTVYRSAQEALTNAIRHGQATRITVELDEELPHGKSKTDGSGVLISLRVSDDGVGMNPGVRAGFGLSAMRERVLSADGSLIIETAKPRGTTVSVKIPARPNEPKHLFASEPIRKTS
jgi:two-component system sensor histidine kinase UhpB